MGSLPSAGAVRATFCFALPRLSAFSMVERFEFIRRFGPERTHREFSFCSYAFIQGRVPSWSPDIANEFIRLASNEGRALDQIRLQKLVYIAHGWQLALTGEPLTGDRPEAWDFGPVYRRLAGALERFGSDGVSEQVETNQSNLDETELAVIARVYQDYGRFSGSQLSNLTRRGNAPWRHVYAEGAGRFRDIPHALIREQFVQLARRSST